MPNCHQERGAMMTKDQVEIGLFHRLEKAELIAEDLSGKLESAEAELAELKKKLNQYFEYKKNIPETMSIFNNAKDYDNYKQVEAELERLKNAERS